MHFSLFRFVDKNYVYKQIKLSIKNNGLPFQKETYFLIFPCFGLLHSVMAHKHDASGMTIEKLTKLHLNE